MKRALLLGAGLALAAAAPAQAAEHFVQGQATLTWDAPDITVAIGDTVTWQFPDTTQNHNVQSQPRDTPDAEWNAFASTIGMPAEPKSFTFNTEGTYSYVCLVHTSTMTGVVRVGNPAPPAVLPLSAQRFGNDDASVFPAERVAEDKAKPSLTGVSARRVARGALRVRFTVSELSVVQVRLKRAGRTVKTVETDARGLRGLTITGAKAGRYSVELRATDIAGNRSAWRRMRMTVR
jgi:plastocyanin